MFDKRLNFSPDRRITCVMQFNGNGHCLFYYTLPEPLCRLPVPCPSYEQRGLLVAVYIDGQAQASSDIPER